MKNMEIVTVDDLIRTLQEYDKDMRVFYGTRYALVPVSVVVMEEKIIVLEMSDEAKKSFEYD